MNHKKHFIQALLYAICLAMPLVACKRCWLREPWGRCSSSSQEALGNEITGGRVPNVGNTCYLNATLQVIAKLYPTLFDNIEAKTENERILKAKGKSIIDKLKEDKENVDQQLAKDFLFAAKQVSQEREIYSIFSDKKTNNMGDMSDAFSFFLEKSEFQHKKIGKTSIVKDCQKKPQFEATEQKEEEAFLIALSLKDSSDKTTIEKLLQKSIMIENHRFAGNKKKEELNIYQGYTRELTSEEYEIRGKGEMTFRFTMTGELPNGILPVKLERDTPESRKIIISNPLQMTTNLGNNCANQSYELVGFVIYTGCHYYTYLKRGGNIWKEYNDNNVTVKDAYKAEKAAELAQMYFYRLKS